MASRLKESGKRVYGFGEEKIPGPFVAACDRFIRANVLHTEYNAKKRKRLKTMALTRDFKKTVVARVERDPAFAKALLDEAATLFRSGELETARLKAYTVNLRKVA